MFKSAGYNISRGTATRPAKSSGRVLCLNMFYGAPAVKFNAVNADAPVMAAGHSVENGTFSVTSSGAVPSAHRAGSCWVSPAS